MYSQTCPYQGTVVGGNHVSVCTQRRKCPNYQKLFVGFKEQTKHKCGHIDCPSCHEYVKAAEHKYYIQIAKSPEQEKEERRKKKKKK